MGEEPVERYRPERASAERHYAAIGKVAAAWAEFEGMLDHRALLLAGFDTHKGMCFSLQIVGPGRKLNAYMATAELRGINQKLFQKTEAASTRCPHDGGEAQ